MPVQSVGVLSPGDMGHSVGEVLRKHGLRVLTCLEGRSERTRALAGAAGFEDVGSIDELVGAVDVLLCILVPSEAPGVARQVAAAIGRTGADPLYVDCNAVAPRTVREIDRAIRGVGGRFADVGIIGPPPRRPGNRFYASGPDLGQLVELSGYGLDVRPVGPKVGQASGLKMCYAALTKGTQALGVELLVAARAMGLGEQLRAELELSRADLLKYLEGATPSMPPKAYRWVGEMEEIATTFEDLGMTPRILLGAADMYRLVADSPIGRESPEERDAARGLEGVVEALAEGLPSGADAVAS